MSPVEIRTTAPDRETAQRIARRLVEDRLAACVQIVGPIESVYRWQGAIETSHEWLCLIKARRDQFEAIAAAIRQSHPYEVPEILALPVVEGSPDYLRWMDES